MFQFNCFPIGCHLERWKAFQCSKVSKYAFGHFKSKQLWLHSPLSILILQLKFLSAGCSNSSTWDLPPRSEYGLCAPYIKSHRYPAIYQELTRRWVSPPCLVDYWSAGWDVEMICIWARALVGFAYVIAQVIIIFCQSFYPFDSYLQSLLLISDA